MSSQIAAIDTTTILLGNQVTIDWHNAVINQSVAPTKTGRSGYILRFFNESGVGWQGNLTPSGTSFFLGAGAWKDIPLANGDVTALLTAAYVIPNAPVNYLAAYIILPTDTPDDIGTLGNSPIGIAGSVTTSGGASLKNDGNPPPTQIIESTPSDQASSSLNINNDGSGYWQVLSAGLLRQLLSIVRGNSGAGKATFTLGDAGDTSITTLNGTATSAKAVAGTGVHATSIVKTDRIEGDTTENVNVGGTGADRSVLVKTDTAGQVEFDATDDGGGHAAGLSLVLAALSGTGALHAGLKVQGFAQDGLTAICQIAIYDTTTGVVRLQQRFIGTTDPTTITGVTVNEGDEWKKI